jgi:hypothetical protein
MIRNNKKIYDPILYERLETKVVGMAVSIPVESRDFSRLQNIQTGSGVYPVSSWIGIGHLSGIKRPGREVNH